MKHTDNDAATGTDDNFSCPYFAAERSKSPVCLEFRLADGARRALPYAFFMEIRFDMDRGIEILTSTKHVMITGRNLGKLFDYLILYRVRFIQANIGNDSEEDGLFVETILIEEP